MAPERDEPLSPEQIEEGHRALRSAFLTAAACAVIAAALAAFGTDTPRWAIGAALGLYLLTNVILIRYFERRRQEQHRDARERAGASPIDPGPIR